MSQSDEDIRKKFEPHNIEWMAEHWCRVYPQYGLKKIERGYTVSYALYEGDEIIGGVDGCDMNKPDRLPYWYAKRGENFDNWLDTSCDLLQALTFVALGKGSYALDWDG